MPEVDLKINSVNFICDWKYNSISNDNKCCICNNVNKYDGSSKRNCTLKVFGIVLGKCGHQAHYSCYKKELNKFNKYGDLIRCRECPEQTNSFVLDRHIETSHTQKLYKI
jgi:hypothetical protein